MPQLKRVREAPVVEKDESVPAPLRGPKSTWFLRRVSRFLIPVLLGLFRRFTRAIGVLAQRSLSQIMLRPRAEAASALLTG